MEWHVNKLHLDVMIRCPQISIWVSILCKYTQKIAINTVYVNVYCHMNNQLIKSCYIYQVITPQGSKRSDISNANFDFHLSWQKIKYC